MGNITAIRDLFNRVDLDDWRVKRLRLIRGLLYFLGTIQLTAGKLKGILLLTKVITPGTVM
jgi:hypothetical protein